MTQEQQTGRVYHERAGHILKITIANESKRNAFVPEMMPQLSDGLTLLDEDPDPLCPLPSPLTFR